MLRFVQWLLAQDWFPRLVNPALGKFNPFLATFRADPYPTYRTLRASAPMYFHPLLRVWILSRYADIAAILSDSRFSVNRQQATLFKRLRLVESLQPDFAALVTGNLLMIDPPHHTRLRRLVNKAFTPRVVEALKPRIQTLADELLDAVADQSEIDVIASLAYPLPVIVICEMLGVPAADRAQLKAWSDKLTGLLDPLQADGGVKALEQSFNELSTYLRRIFAERRAEPRDDLISALVRVEEQGDVLSDRELLALCALLLAAGNETTTNLIGNGVLALLRHPEQRRLLQDDPSLIRGAVEELLRFDSPVQLTDRVATENCEIAGNQVRKGQLVTLLLGSANRDPEQFADPENLDLRRTDNDHLAFSHGVHFCLGAALARAEAQIAIATLLQRFPNFSGRAEPGAWKRSMVLRGPTSLRLQLR